MHATVTTARDEWRSHAMLPVAAGLGYATSVIHIYGIGPYIAPVAESFGWSRTEVTFGLNWHPTPFVEIRPEIRGDFASRPAFGGNNTPRDYSQLSGAISALFKF